MGILNGPANVAFGRLVLVGRGVSGLHDEALGGDEVLDSHELLRHATCLLDMLGLLLTLKQLSFLAFLSGCR